MTTIDNIQLWALAYIKHYTISGQDTNRPWGGFYYIDDRDLDRFVAQYFSVVVSEKNKGLSVGIKEALNEKVPISPKILVVSPGKRLSWQYHHRRKEIWSVLVGPVGIVRSKTDDETDMVVVDTGDIITIDKEERHRIVGLDNYAVIAELWCHCDINNPSDEMDIIRVQDDFKR